MPDKPDYIEHRKRLRERYRRSGASGLADYELLELLITYAVPRRDVKPVAKTLFKRYGGVAGVLDADPNELELIEGLGEASATLIALVKGLCGAYLEHRMRNGGDALTSPRLVADFARMRLAALAHEAFMVVYLNVKNEVIHYETLQEGTVDHVVVYPRRIVEAALSHRATGVILVHNHPSGSIEPSEQDKRLTSTIAKAAQPLDIKVLDHIIVAKGGYFSFTENKLL
ncbi:MAG: RadC family protein [Deltaproteobacteria bacterium]